MPNIKKARLARPGKKNLDGGLMSNDKLYKNFNKNYRRCQGQSLQDTTKSPIPNRNRKEHRVHPPVAGLVAFFSMT